ncbi:hypothetical protein ACF0H5_018651 [Mactra antiquata]
MENRQWAINKNEERQDQPNDVESYPLTAFSPVSFHSSEWHEHENPVKLDRRRSVASSLTEVLIKGRQPHSQSSGISLKEQSNFVQPVGEEIQYEDLYKASKQKKKEEIKKKNIRASMSFWKLIWFDFKHWYKRWRVKNQETIMFKHYIKTMESNFGSAIGSLFVFMRWTMFLNLLLSIMWIGLVVFPTAIFFQYDQINGEFAIKNILDGKGMLAQIWFFYGAYPQVSSGYHVDLAYLFMMLVTYYGSLFVILGSISEADRSRSTSTHSVKYKFSLMLWTSWDHSITSHEASINLSKGVTSAFKDNLYEAKASQNVKERSGKEKCKVFFLRCLAWLITIILIGGGCAAIVYLVVFMSFEDVIPNTGSGKGSDFISVYGTTIVFILINALVPGIVQKLPKMECYASGKDELNVTITRVFFLRMANLFALITSLYNTVTKSVEGCAGTVIGQEMYKLVIMDTILHSVIQLSVKFAKHFWTKSKEEFNMSSAVLVLVYRQALVWAGTLACPILPVIGLLSNLIFFAVNYTIVSKTCKPPMKRWNQSRNTRFFTVFLLGSLLMLIIPASVVIGSSNLVSLGLTDKEGVYCGPFRSEKPTKAYTKFGLDQVGWLQETLGYLVSEPVLIPVFMILFSVMVHQRKQIGREKRQRILLQAELQQERDESQHLLKKLQSMGVDVERY